MKIASQPKKTYPLEQYKNEVLEEIKNKLYYKTDYDAKVGREEKYKLKFEIQNKEKSDGSRFSRQQTRTKHNTHYKLQKTSKTRIKLND